MVRVGPISPVGVALTKLQSANPFVSLFKKICPCSSSPLENAAIQLIATYKSRPSTQTENKAQAAFQKIFDTSCKNNQLSASNELKRAYLTQVCKEQGASKELTATVLDRSCGSSFGTIFLTVAALGVIALGAASYRSLIASPSIAEERPIKEVRSGADCLLKKFLAPYWKSIFG